MHTWGVKKKGEGEKEREGEIIYTIDSYCFDEF